ncbi:MAG: acyl-CoA dehydrogenase family protein [Gammaproteobacteria bacterium]|nr:acyl-CoA dehydrogenase family protein [Gammaproteobacteria bacterium]MCP5198242.1 acyl-CoA dehydrogenase family protein [Gammaproteobacteria bacterium]
MDFSLSEEQRLLRDNIIRFAKGALNDKIIDRDRDQEFSKDLWRKCGEIGIQGLPVPEEYGGSHVDPLSCAIALEALGYGCHDGGLVFSLSAHLLACVVPIWQHGTAEQKRRYLPGLCDGRLIGSHAITEPGSGSDSFSMRTRADKIDGGWRINGTKTFISNGPAADVAIVFAVTDPGKGFHGGATAFLVETSWKGVATSKKFEKLGLRTSPIGELIFEDLDVPDDAVIGKIGSGSAVFGTAMDWERTLLVAGHVGVIERLLETAVMYARTRNQFNQAIGKFQAISHKIADMKVQLEAARLLAYQAAWKLGHARSASLDASIGKLFVSESLLKCALECVQIHGGYGFMVEYQVERALRDAIAGTIYSGTSEMQRNIIARWLGL